MSVSWKAQCFMDEEEQRKYKDHSDDLTKEKVFEVPSITSTTLCIMGNAKLPVTKCPCKLTFGPGYVSKLCVRVDRRCSSPT